MPFAYIEKVLEVLKAHEKWGQKQKCCVYNFVQCMYIKSSFVEIDKKISY